MKQTVEKAEEHKPEKHSSAYLFLFKHVPLNLPQGFWWAKTTRKAMEQESDNEYLMGHFINFFYIYALFFQ